LKGIRKELLQDERIAALNEAILVTAHARDKLTSTRIETGDNRLQAYIDEYDVELKRLFKEMEERVMVLFPSLLAAFTVWGDKE